MNDLFGNLNNVLFQVDPIAQEELIRKINRDSAIMNTAESVENIGDNVENIKNDVFDIRTELSELHHEIELLKQENVRREQELSAEKARAEEVEKKAKRQAQWFSFLTVLLSVTLSYAFPRFISWIQSLLQ